MLTLELHDAQKIMNSHSMDEDEKALLTVFLDTVDRESVLSDMNLWDNYYALTDCSQYEQRFGFDLLRCLYPNTLDDSTLALLSDPGKLYRVDMTRWT